jgi:hypothetical protein
MNGGYSLYLDQLELKALRDGIRGKDNEWFKANVQSHSARDGLKLKNGGMVIPACVELLAAEVDKAQHQAHLTEQALTAARAEIADLRAEIGRRDARERARHPVVRRIAHALYVRRGVE